MSVKKNQKQQQQRATDIPLKRGEHVWKLLVLLQEIPFLAHHNMTWLGQTIFYK